MKRAVYLVKDAGQTCMAAAVAACLLAMGLAACSSPMPPWEPPCTIIQPALPPPRPAPAPPTPLPPAPAMQPAPTQPPAYVPPPAGDTELPRATPGMASPASTYCLQRGGQLEFSTRANGAEVGACVNPGGDECEERAFLYGSCTQ